MDAPEKRCRVCRYVGLGICAILFGVPALAFLVIITWGVILLPLAGVLVLSPLLAANYLAWKRSDSRRKARAMSC